MKEIVKMYQSNNQIYSLLLLRWNKWKNNHQYMKAVCKAYLQQGGVNIGLKFSPIFWCNSFKSFRLHFWYGKMQTIKAILFGRISDPVGFYPDPDPISEKKNRVRFQPPRKFCLHVQENLLFNFFFRTVNIIDMYWLYYHFSQ